MAVTKADVLRIAPELGPLSISDPDWNGFILDASAQVNPTYWGARTDLGVKYLAAHLVAIAYPQAGGRTLQSITVGPVTQTFATPSTAGLSSDDAWLATTRFGAEFTRLRRSLGRRFLVA